MLPDAAQRTKAPLSGISSLLNNLVFSLSVSEFRLLLRLEVALYVVLFNSARPKSKLRIMFWPSGFAIGRGCKQLR
jgi:hypothetical protein